MKFKKEVFRKDVGDTAEVLLMVVAFFLIPYLVGTVIDNTVMGTIAPDRWTASRCIDTTWTPPKLDMNDSDAQKTFFDMGELSEGTCGLVVTAVKWFIGFAAIVVVVFVVVIARDVVQGARDRWFE